MTRFRFQREYPSWQHARAAVSLHSHTLHSRESLDFIGRLAARIPPIGIALRHGSEQYWRRYGRKLDLSQAWWTPPLSAHQAWLLEKASIEDALGLPALVSLTDHDDIDAPESLRVLSECRDLPVSVEWTVPYAGTFFHLGVHNLNPSIARHAMDAMRSYTSCPDDEVLESLLDWFSSSPATLLVFNHPCWDEKGIGANDHFRLAHDFYRRFSNFIHAFELNGLRPWNENREAIRFATACDRPVISGGDRHTIEPNAVLNLTTACSFDEFVAQIRSGESEVLITPTYCESFSLRMLRNIGHVLASYDSHSHGWRLWSDRVFHRGVDGAVRPLTALWGSHDPLAVRLFVRGVQMLHGPTLQGPLRSLFGAGQEVTL
jgi:hypothetical protein